MNKTRKLGKKSHTGRPDLTGEHRYGDAGQIVFLAVFMVIWIADSFILHYTDFIAADIPLYFRLPTGIILVCISAYFARAGLTTVFGKAEDAARVFCEGVFGRTRHPIYFGTLILYLALIVMTLSLAAAVLWLIIIAFYHYIARYEEKLLLERFGDQYRRYMAHVPMWLPGSRSRRPV